MSWRCKKLNVVFFFFFLVLFLSIMWMKHSEFRQNTMDVGRGFSIYFQITPKNSTFSTLSPNQSQTFKVQAVAMHNTTKTSDIIFTMKTTKKFHEDRVELALKTWCKGVEKQVYLITDENDPFYAKKTGGNLVVTGCGKTHNLIDLCCKTDEEYDVVSRTMGDAKYKWWCHFDDDSYVNVHRLIDVLNKHNATDSVYIGRKSRPFMPSTYKNKPIKAIFATGGAGYCITRKVVERMGNWIGNGTFPGTCRDLRMADDCSLGYVVTEWLKVPLTESLLFHSHLEKLNKIPTDNLTQQVSLSYSVTKETVNVVNIPENKTFFTKKEDPTRILSLHCLNFPDADICLKKKT